MACLTVHPLKDILVVFSFWLLQIRLLWIFMCRFSGQFFNQCLPQASLLDWRTEPRPGFMLKPTDLLSSLAPTNHFQYNSEHLQSRQNCIMNTCVHHSTLTIIILSFFSFIPAPTLPLTLNYFEADPRQYSFICEYFNVYLWKLRTF